MFHDSILIQNHDFPAEQSSQFVADDFLLHAYTLAPWTTRPGTTDVGASARASAGGPFTLTITRGLLRIFVGRSRIRGFALTDAGSWEIVLFVDGLDGALEAAEERLGAKEGRGEVDCVGEFVD